MIKILVLLLVGLISGCADLGMHSYYKNAPEINPSSDEVDPNLNK
jgi:hypothetical protein